MRTRSLALLLALIAVGAGAAGASAAGPAVPVKNASSLSSSPPVPLPASGPASHSAPGPRASDATVVPAGRAAALPRTGSDVRVVGLVGMLLVVAGICFHVGLPDASGRRRR
jgi:hypothetical protein